MPYKNSWGTKAKKRSKKRTKYFVNYRRTKAKKKAVARQQVYLAIKDGTLTPKACEHFNEDCKGRTEAHHDDYDQPLKVRWFCSFHHREEHNTQNEKKHGVKECLICGVEIKPPKKKYCSDGCNLKGWRKGL